MAGRGSAPGERRGGRCAGTPNRTTAEIRKAAEPYGPAAIERLAQLAGLTVDDDGNPVPGAASEQTQVAAIRELLDRGFGKASQPIGGEDGGPVTLIVATGVPRSAGAISAVTSPLLEADDAEADADPLATWVSSC